MLTLGIALANSRVQPLRHIPRKVRFIESEHEELIWVCHAVRMMRVRDRSEEVVIVGNEERVLSRFTDSDVVTEREAFQLGGNFGSPRSRARSAPKRYRETKVRHQAA